MSRQVIWIIVLSLLISIGFISYHSLAEVVNPTLYVINGLCLGSLCLAIIVLRSRRHAEWAQRAMSGLLTLTIFVVIGFDLYLDLSLKNVFLYLFPAEFVYLFGIYALKGKGSLQGVIQRHYERLAKHTH